MRKTRDECDAREELFCQLVVYQNMVPSQAMIEAGWAESTVRSNGPGYVANRPRVKKRMAELRENVLAKHGHSLETVFMSLDHHVGDAIEVQAELMRNAESESVRQRASATIIETGKGLLIAAMPKKVTFEVRMSELAAEGKKRLAEGETIDITPLEVCDSDEEDDEE